jgi:hypothetical protein
MISDVEDRIGKNGIEEIKIHPFFNGLDWKRIREKRPPYVPEVKVFYNLRLNMSPILRTLTNSRRKNLGFSFKV